MRKNTTAADRQDDGFAATLEVLRAAFELRKPDSFQTAVRLRAKYAHAAHVILKSAKTEAGGQRGQGALARVHAIDALIHDYRNANLTGDRGRSGPTPEAAVRPRRSSPLEALAEAGHLDHGQVRAAAQIAEIVEAVASGLGVKSGAALRDGGGSSRQSGGYIPPLLSDWYSLRYLPWIGAMRSDLTPDLRDDRRGRGRNQHLPLVQMVVVDGVSLAPAARAHGMSWLRGLRLLRNGLELYDRIVQDERHGKIHWDLQGIALS